MSIVGMEHLVDARCAIMERLPETTDIVVEHDPMILATAVDPLYVFQYTWYRQGVGAVDVT
jgi:hypothetical protein